MTGAEDEVVVTEAELEVARAVDEAVTLLQAAFRGSRVRQRLQVARGCGGCAVFCGARPRLRAQTVQDNARALFDDIDFEDADALTAEFAAMEDFGASDSGASARRAGTRVCATICVCRARSRVSRALVSCWNEQLGVIIGSRRVRAGAAFFTAADEASLRAAREDVRRARAIAAAAEAASALAARQAALAAQLTEQRASGAAIAREVGAPPRGTPSAHRAAHGTQAARMFEARSSAPALVTKAPPMDQSDVLDEGSWERVSVATRDSGSMAGAPPRAAPAVVAVAAAWGISDPRLAAQLEKRNRRLGGVRAAGPSKDPIARCQAVLRMVKARAAADAASTGGSPPRGGGGGGAERWQATALHNRTDKDRVARRGGRRAVLPAYMMGAPRLVERVHAARDLPNPTLPWRTQGHREVLTTRRRERRRCRPWCRVGGPAP